MTRCQYHKQCPQYLHKLWVVIIYRKRLYIQNSDKQPIKTLSDLLKSVIHYTPKDYIMEQYQGPLEVCRPSAINTNTNPTSQL